MLAEKPFLAIRTIADTSHARAAAHRQHHDVLVGAAYGRRHLIAEDNQVIDRIQICGATIERALPSRGQQIGFGACVISNCRHSTI